MLDLVLLAAVLHKLDRLGTRKLEHGELEVLFDDLLHLGLDSRQVVLADLLVTKVDIIVKTVIGRGTVGKISLGIQALDGLCHDVRGRMANHMGYLILGQLGDSAVVVQRFHICFSSRKHIDGNKRGLFRAVPQA